jgi:WD40 repeat protein
VTALTADTYVESNACRTTTIPLLLCSFITELAGVSLWQHASRAHNSQPCLFAPAYRVQEQQQHKGPVTQLLFTPDGSRLLSCAADGKLVACDTSKQCTPVKVLLPANMTSSNSSSSSSVGQAQLPVCAAVSPDGQLVAVGSSAASPAAGAGGATISVFAAGSLEAVLCMETTAQGFVRWAGVAGI